MREELQSHEAEISRLREELSKSSDKSSKVSEFEITFQWTGLEYYRLEHGVETQDKRVRG